jgi:hypothetical protein
MARDESLHWQALMNATANGGHGTAELACNTKRHFDDFIWSFLQPRRVSRAAVQYWLFIERAAEYAYRYGALRLGDYIVFKPVEWSTQLNRRAATQAPRYSVTVFFPQTDLWSMGRGIELYHRWHVVPESEETKRRMLLVRHKALLEFSSS